MGKLKHSKFKNTGILFELLVRQIASDTLSDKTCYATEIIKKHFSSEDHQQLNNQINSSQEEETMEI